MARIKTMGLVLAMTLGAASVSLAQEPQHDRDSQHGSGAQQWQGQRGHQGGFGFLLKGIDLTEQQRSQLRALREKQGQRTNGGDRSEIREQIDAARERGDTAALRRIRTQMRAQMQQRHERMIADVRSILTPAQRELFDRNVKETE